MTNLSIAERLGEDFLAQALHRDYRHVSKAVDVAGLMTWDDLDRILTQHRLEPPRLRLARDGQTLPLSHYATPVSTRRHTVWHRLQPAGLHPLLADGASLALDGADQLHRPLARLAEDLERTFRTDVRANVYASWTPTEGFGVHWDDHAVLVVQLDGAKRWRLFGQTRPAPLYRDTELPPEPPSDPLADLVLHPGDLLYVPRGWWHSASADQGGPSLHATFGFEPHTPVNLLDWLAEQLISREEFRTDLPLLDTPEAQAATVRGLRKLLLAELDDPELLARYATAMDGRSVGRLAPSLPYVGGVPADPGLRVRMTTARAVLTTTGDTVLLAAAGSEYEFAPAAEPVLRPLVDGQVLTLADLAAAADLDIAGIVALVGELVDGQAAAVGNLL
ncbi:cupin domain-containing protein [Streptomyces sp. NPDC056178]|uniref:cupin domain-containing protein n=1 Tax=Streptomyces sp. NPDC056178 TaxID=3345735 RepID=UPI0035D6BA83